ncbi:hypothetical protein ABT369_52700 [Dactylosporangium sp. NPDC000244]|uniref:hypothetical protein n=1 Tax=Dactylosporangium sp. NPDC000244 TaxID=3154365 RepID=UPI003334362E
MQAYDEIYRDGITACRGAFPVEWADRMREDMDAALAEALARPGGAVGRGPNRHYVEIHPEQLRGFADLASHPWVTAVCEAVLGPRYQIVELGFDVPGAGNDERHAMAVIRDYHAALPAVVRDHLTCAVVGTLVPIEQKHTIEGLVMGDA